MISNRIDRYIEHKTVQNRLNKFTYNSPPLEEPGIASPTEFIAPLLPGNKLFMLLVVFDKLNIESGLFVLSRKVDESDDGCAVVTKFATPIFSSFDCRVFIN